MRENHEAGRATMADAEAAYREAFPVALAMGRAAGLDEDEQEEVAQRLGLVLVERLADFDAAKGTWRAWGLGIVRNLVLDAQRRVQVEEARRATHVPVSRLPASSLTPEQAVRAREALAIVRATVRPEHRAVFELDALGCTAEEIAALLDLPRSTVEWRLREAREDLDRALARLREDRASASRVRAVLCPFASETEVGRALPPLGDEVPTLRPPLWDAVPTLRPPLGDAVPTLHAAREAGAVRGADAPHGGGDPPRAPRVRSAWPRAPIFLGWSVALSRVVALSLITCMLLSVHLVRIAPAELAAGGAPVTARTIAESDAEDRTAAHDAAPGTAPTSVVEGVPAQPATSAAPALAGEPFGRAPARPRGLRPWMKLNELARQQAARRAAAEPQVGGTK